MDAHLFRLLALEAAVLTRGARVEKIHSPAPGLLTFSLYNFQRKYALVLRREQGAPGQGKTQPCLYLGAVRPPNPAAPAHRVMVLRKHLLSRRLGAASSDWLNRRLFIHAPGEPPLWLCLDLREGARLYAKAPEPLAPVWPDPLPQNHQEALSDRELWRLFPVLTPPLRRSLAALDYQEAQALLGDLALESARGAGAVSRYSRDGASCLLSAWPLPPALRAGMQEETLPSGQGASDGDAGPTFPWLEAARDVYEADTLASLGLFWRKDELKAEQQAQKRRLKTLRKLEAEEDRLRGLLAGRAGALALQACLWQHDPAAKLSRLRIAAPNNSPPNNLAQDNSNSNSNSDEHYLELELNPALSLSENMAAMFRRTARAERGLAMLSARRAALAAGHWAERPAWTPQQAAAPGNKTLDREKVVQRFISSDGLTLLRGRSAKGNLALLKLARPFDLWLHVLGGPSAHVLIRLPHPGAKPPEATLREAGLLSALKSWRKNDAKAEIIQALARDVRATGQDAPGSARVDKIQASFIVSLEQAGPEFEAALSRRQSLTPP